MAAARPQMREGDLKLVHPFEIIIPRPAEYQLPRPSRDRDQSQWLQEVDEKATEADEKGDYDLACFYYGTAFHVSANSPELGKEDINTLFFEQKLAENFFDNDRLYEAQKLFYDILFRAERIQTAEGPDKDLTELIEFAVGCLCQWAERLFDQPRFDKARKQYERIHHKCVTLLGPNHILTKKTQKNLDNAAVAEKLAVSKALEYPKKLQEPSVEKGTGKVQVDDVSKSKAEIRPKSLSHRGKSEDRKSIIHSPSPNDKDREQIPIRSKSPQPAGPGKARTPIRAEKSNSSNAQDHSPISGEKSTASFSPLPLPDPAEKKSPPRGSSKRNSQQLEVPGSRDGLYGDQKKGRSQSVGGELRHSAPKDHEKPTSDVERPRTGSDAGMKQHIIHGKTFDVVDASSSPVDLETWSGGMLKKTHEFLQELRKDSKYSTRTKSRRRVRIAILDTGIDMTHPEIRARSNRIIQTFCEIKELETKGNEDESGHGTHAALLILKLAPEADLYVARVFKDTSNVTDIYVGSAITRAVNTWEVDIISMSFGFSTVIPHISDALKAAAAKDVVLFASASNEGGNPAIPKAWPARGDMVFCIHATDPFGNSYKFNPPRKLESANFATLGENVLSAWKQQEMQAKSGTSIATPIAAATAALFIDFSRLPKLRGREPIRYLPQIASYQGIKALLLASSLKTDERNFRYIKPWHIFEQKGFEYNRVGFKIEDALQKYFGVGGGEFTQ